MHGDKRLRCALIICGAAVWVGDESFAQTWRSAGEPQIQQQGGSWQIDFCLQNHSDAQITIRPEDLRAAVTASVSNSIVPAHARSRDCGLVLTGGQSSAVGEVIQSADVAARCELKATLHFWEDGKDAPVGFMEKEGLSKNSSVVNQTPLYTKSGGKIHIGLRLEHQHYLYGDYDPLVGWYHFKLELGGSPAYDDCLEMQEQYRFRPRVIWANPPEERRDIRHFVSAPDSLHLEAHVPGNHSYHFSEQPVRYSTKMRLRFWYLIATGTEGECKTTITQYQDTPTAWKILPNRVPEQCLTTIGRWVKVERFFCTEKEATTLSMDFIIGGGDGVGEMWIDDISLEPVSRPPARP